MIHAGILHKAIADAGIRIHSVSVGRPDDMSTWVVAPDSPEARAVLGSKTLVQWQRESDLADLRAQRTAKLSASDWTQLADAPAQTKAAWVTYRQQLRDLPATVADPSAPVWPTPPSA